MYIYNRNFQEAVLFRDTGLLDRIFSAFDVNGMGTVTFSDYIQGLSKLSNKASITDKLQCKLVIIMLS